MLPQLTMLWLHTTSDLRCRELQSQRQRSTEPRRRLLATTFMSARLDFIRVWLRERVVSASACRATGQCCQVATSDHNPSATTTTAALPQTSVARSCLPRCPLVSLREQKTQSSLTWQRRSVATSRRISSRVSGCKRRLLPLGVTRGADGPTTLKL
jgi:hypothetical protein